MAISIIDGFNVTSALPADLKTIISTSSSLTSISSSWRYNGMLVYTQAEGQEWRLIGGVSDSNWKLMAAEEGATINCPCPSLQERMRIHEIGRFFMLLGIAHRVEAKKRRLLTILTMMSN